jgi:hypothetical protein
MSRVEPTSLYLAFRGPSPDKPLTWNDYLLGCITGSASVTHVEPVLLFPCTLSSPDSPMPCRFCNHNHNNNNNDNDHNNFDLPEAKKTKTKRGKGSEILRKYHWVSYGVYRIPQRDHVYEWIDKAFNLAVYQFIYIPCEARQLKQAYAFLLAQRGKPFNYREYRSWIFRPCFCVPQGCMDESKADETQAWICSEMSTVALQRCGYVSDLLPCNTSPYDLVNALLSSGLRGLRVLSSKKSKKLFS